MSVHRIDDRDLRLACGRVFGADANQLLRAIQIARLDREIDELQVKTNAAIAALHEPSRGAAEVVARHDAIDRLFKRMDRLTRERFGYDPQPDEVRRG